MTNCFDINLHLNPLKEDIDIKSYGTSRHMRIPISDLNIKLIRLLNDLDLRIVLAEMFYTKPKSFTDIHVDVSGGDYIKMNYIYGGKDSNMIWYKPKLNIEKSTSTTCIGTSYMAYDLHEVEIIGRQTVGFPSIVQAGIPHNIINYEEPRYCLSVVFVKKTGRELLTMTQAIDLFDKYSVKLL